MRGKSFVLAILYLPLKVTPTTFSEISESSHICSIFRKIVCSRVVYFETAQVLFSLLFPEKGGQNSENFLNSEVL